jgi:ABC-type glycerol-3-phosphate transport system permease component
MDRKLVAVVTLILFTLFSCESISINKVVRKSNITAVRKTREIPYESRKSIKVLGVVTTANKWIEFEDESGRILLHVIEGEVADESGRRLKRISIPLSEVKWVWLKKFSMGKTLWNYLLVPAGVVFISGSLILFIAFAVSDPFCP